MGLGFGMFFGRKSEGEFHRGDPTGANQNFHDLDAGDLSPEKNVAQISDIRQRLLNPNLDPDEKKFLTGKLDNLLDQQQKDLTDKTIN